MTNKQNFEVNARFEYGACLTPNTKDNDINNISSKQTLIDGVDVSGCNFSLERDGKIKCECTHATGFGIICDCESWKTCDYKNYKRKEQECEELKKDKFALELRLDELTSPVNVEDCEHSVFNGEYIACRYYEGQRCDDADFANCMYRENIRLKQQLDQLKAENDLYKNAHKTEQDRRRSYENALTEIKEIAKKENNDTKVLYNRRTYQRMKQILQKISECEVV